jgi:colanic acid biosynthesis glycosyl transferase WcaI
VRILIHGINFSPELSGIGKFTGELVEWLASRQHDIKVVTAPPYYPQWSVVSPYSAFRYESELKGRVIRCPLWVPLHPSSLKRIIHLASFAISSFPIMLTQARWRPDVVWVVEPALFCAPGALLAAKLSDASTWLHVQDFEVDAAFELGFLNSARLRKLAGWAESWLMQRFDRVSTISTNMLKRLEDKQINSGKGIFFPNWVDTDLIRPLDSPSSFRKALGISSEVTVALYSGNMGNKQGLEILVAAAKLHQDRKDLKFLFCGDGAGRDRLVAEASELRNVGFLPLQPLERLNDLLNLADIHLLPQRADAADLVMPSKLTGMFASGRPVVATANHGTQLAKVVAGKGIVVNADDGEAFANAIGLLADDVSRRIEMGAAAREYAIANLGKDAILTKFENSLFELVNERRRDAKRL